VNALMTRQSILLRKKMDARVKPAHDDSASTAINRRAFTSLLAAAAGAAAWPLAARAQQMPVIGYLGSLSPNADAGRLSALRQSLAAAGYSEGTSLAIEYRWAEGDYDRLAAYAAEFVRRDVAVIFAAALPSALAAKAATSSIPIVFVMGADPVKLGVVASLNQPGGNVTGVCQFIGALGGKRLELIRELVPGASLIAILANPKNPNAEDHLADIEAAARAMGQRTLVVPVSADADIEPAFATMAQQHASALLVADDPFLGTRGDQLVAQAMGCLKSESDRCRRHVEPAHARDLAARSVDARNRRFDRFERDRHVEGIGVNERSFVAHDRHVPVPEQKVAAPQLRVLRKRAAERLFLHVAVARARDAASVKRDLHEA
jgi:putative ABC transport system substrate-binding protein